MESEPTIAPKLVKGDTITLPTTGGFLKVTHYDTSYPDQPLMMFASLIESPEGVEEIPILRMHSKCLFGESFGSQKCECGPQLEEGIAEVITNKGILVYLDQEGRGHSLHDKFREYKLQEQGLDTFQASEALGLKADARSYEVVADILKERGITKVRLLSNNPDKVSQLRNFGIEVVESVASDVEVNEYNKRYLDAKAARYSNDTKNV